MNRLTFLLVFFPFFTYSVSTNNTEQYKNGRDFSNSIKPNLNDIKNFDTDKFIDGGINSNPNETKYYKNENALTGDGVNQFNQSELKESIMDSMNNKPLLTKDDELISDSLKMQNGIVKDEKGNFCIPTITYLTSPIYNEKSCLQDNEYGYCKLTPIVTWKEEHSTYEEYTETKNLYPNLEKSNEKEAFFEFTPTYNGKLIRATIDYSNNAEGKLLLKNGNVVTPQAWQEQHTYRIFNKIFTKKVKNLFYVPRSVNYQITFGGYSNDAIYDVNGKQEMTINLSNNSYWRGEVYADKLLQYHFAKNFMCNNKFCRKVTITYTILVEKKHQSPIINWKRDCDFEFDERANIKNYNHFLPQSSNYKMIKNECSIRDAEKTFSDEVGGSHTIRFPCLEYDETYEKKINISPSCAILNNDKNCTQMSKSCVVYDEKNNCTQYSIKYSCESYKKEGVQCGELFYTNCETEECNENHKNADFGEVSSKLQMVTEAASNIIEDPENIKIFSGKSLKCRKAMAGYNNCCSESGWGQDLGMAGCNSEEKELRGAKNKGLVISVGEYCSSEKLGICLQKKRSYCVFNSKLAKIVQQQGRLDQLKIGFGSKKHPDCRGLTLDEFEKINFDIINFSEFYKDSYNKTNFPNEDTIKNRIKK